MRVRTGRCYRKAPRGLVSFFVLCAVLFIILEGFIFTERKLRPALMAIARAKANAVAVDAVNEAILNYIASGIAYEDLIKIEQDEHGRIVMACLNTVEANRIMAAATIAAREALSGLEARSIRIPLGEASGSFFLAAYGPKITVKLIPTGQVNTKLVDSFESAGINQTRHKLYLHIGAEVQIVIPFNAGRVNVVTAVPVTDNVYIGEVPGTVINLQFPDSRGP